MSNTYHRAPDAVAAAPDGCPVDREFSPLSDAYLADPYPIANTLRDRCPVSYAERLGHVVVTRLEDIEEVFTHPDVYASTNVQDPIFPLAPEAAAILASDDFDPVAVMSNRPEPDHTRIRVYTRQGFSNRRLKVLEHYQRDRASDLIDRMLEGGNEADFVQAVAFPLPAEIVFRLIGFPPEDDRMIKRWCVNRKAFSWGQPSAEEQVRIAQGMVDYWRYCRAFVASRAADRRDDYCSELLDAHDADPDPSNGTGISYREVESVVYGISFAGHDPVTALICNTLRCLLSRRDQWQAIIDDPSLIPNAVDETLRYDSSQIGWRRLTTSATTLGGVELPAGTRLYLNLAAANHDPAMFDQPEDFDIRRPNANRHISFGKGIHYCLGSNLAKQETRVVLELLTQKVPSLRLVEDQDFVTFPNITFRGPEQLRVAWDA
ncbi:MAG: cytochrome P450 [Ilumatobacteraceae bacterium]